jgi:pyridoxine 5-phosphate synthase
LNYHNVHPVARLPKMRELNIGHSIIARALMVGMQAAVREMRTLMLEATRDGDAVRRSCDG